MTLSRSLLVCLVVVPLVAAGCRSTSWLSKGEVAATDPPPVSVQREGSQLAGSPATHSVHQASSQSPATSEAHLGPITETPSGSATTDEVVLRELQTISAVDPIAAQQLIHHLQEVKPTLRPLAAQQFRASWQYHRELTGASDTAIEAPFVPPTPEVQVPAASPTPLPPPDEAAASPPAPGTGPMNSAAAPVAAPPAKAPVQQASYVEATVEPPATEVADASAEVPTEEPVEKVAEKAAPANSTEALDWHEAVDRAIDHLAEVTPEEPHSTAEAYQHARLRLLQLIAGSQDAMSPIPGLTPTEQGYWSNQMFALQTLLDQEQEMDDQQRAALARSHLGDADTKLGEVAALSVMNLTFCSEVLAYGNYKPLSKPSFRAGQSVRLYAEIENFRSESAESGFHTSLATSYEVLDMNGNRVAEGEFATVDDYCQRKRRDFYMEFSFELPSRIYANRYKLQVLVRDRLSGKLGKSAVEFEIAE